MTDPHLEKFKLFLNDPYLRQSKTSNVPINVQKSIDQVIRPEKTRPYPQHQQTATFNGSYNPRQEFQSGGNGYNDSYVTEEKRMNELVQILNQGLKNFDQNNRGVNRDTLDDFPSKANLNQSREYEGLDRRFLDPRDNSPQLFKASESVIRHNDSRLLDYEEPLELKYNSYDYQNNDAYGAIGRNLEPLYEKERMFEEQRRFQNKGDAYNLPSYQSNDIRTLQKENLELTRKFLAQGALIRNLEAENKNLRQELNKTLNGRGSHQSFRPYNEANQASLTESKKLITDNEKLVSQISDERREKNQLQNLLNMKIAELREFNTLKERVAIMETEVNKKTEAVLTLSNLLKTEKMKNGDLIESFRSLEMAYQKLQMNVNPPFVNPVNAGVTDLKNELKNNLNNNNNNNYFVPQFGGSVQNQNNSTLNQTQSTLINPPQSIYSEQISREGQNQILNKSQTQSQSQPFNQSQIQSNSQILTQPPQPQSQSLNTSQVQGQSGLQSNTQNQVQVSEQGQGQGQGQVPINPQTNAIFSQVQFPSLNELPEAVRIALQGSIKSLLQVQSSSPTKSMTSQNKTSQSNNQNSASPNSTAVKK